MTKTNPVIDCLMNHRSVRKFKPEPIPQETIETILQAGTRAATAGSIQPYAFIVIDDPAVLKKVSYIEGPLAIVAVVDQYRVKRYYEAKGAPFYNDHAINLFISTWDATLALQNVVVAAESLGLGTVYIGMILGIDVREALVHRNGYRIPSDDDVRAWYREADERWRNWFVNEASDEQRKKFTERGVTNRAQHITLGHYTEKFVKHETKGLLANLEAAGFRVTGDA